MITLHPAIGRPLGSVLQAIARMSETRANHRAGLFADALPGLDAIAVGPQLYDVHTPDEHMELASFERFYVLLVDALEPLAKALASARRTRSIALQSVFAGLGLSVLGMLVAAFGYLPPVQGALFQEAIDIVVILNALRALR